MKYSQEKVDEIIRLYKSGLDQVQVAKRFNTYNTTIRRILLRNNVKILNGSERTRKILPTHFNDFSNKEIQYWIGVILTDGCITKGALVLAVKDYSWVKKFRDFLNPEINITKDPHEIWRVAARSKGITKELEKYGIVPRKSLTLESKFPITYPMLRGIIDGDGCVSKSGNCGIHINVCSGSKIFINQIYNFLKKEGFNPRLSEVMRVHPLYILELNKKYEIATLFLKLYPNADVPKLDRKYNKFIELFKLNIEKSPYQKIRMGKEDKVMFMNSLSECDRYFKLKKGKIKNHLKRNKKYNGWSFSSYGLKDILKNKLK